MELPNILSVGRNHEEMARLIHEIERVEEGGPRAITPPEGGLRPEDIDIGGLVVLTATIEGTATREVGLGRWQMNWIVDPKVARTAPSVVGIFQEFGLYGYESESFEVPRSVEESGVRILKVQKGKKEAGQAARSVVDKVEALMGGKAWDDRVLDTAINEALKNAREHSLTALDTGPTWWLSATYKPSNGLLKVAAYDRGIGMAESVRRALRRRQKWALVPTLQDREEQAMMDNDPALLEHAHRQDFTCTDETTRGRGLPWEVQAYIGGHEKTKKPGRAGIYQVTSGRGVYRLRRVPGHTAEVQLTAKRGKIPGTLLEWSTVISAEEIRNHEPTEDRNEETCVGRPRLPDAMR